MHQAVTAVVNQYGEEIRIDRSTLIEMTEIVVSEDLPTQQLVIRLRRAGV
jgi:hypothetical protein